jgi:hypothetical protein
MNIKVRHIEEIARLDKKPITELQKMNRDMERTYAGDELTKYELIYQIVFQADAPLE